MKTLKLLRAGLRLPARLVARAQTKRNNKKKLFLTALYNLFLSRDNNNNKNNSSHQSKKHVSEIINFA